MTLTDQRAYNNSVKINELTKIVEDLRVMELSRFNKWSVKWTSKSIEEIAEKYKKYKNGPIYPHQERKIEYLRRILADRNPLLN